jgi:hypothetical protein
MLISCLLTRLDFARAGADAANQERQSLRDLSAAVGRCEVPGCPSRMRDEGGEPRLPDPQPRAEWGPVEARLEGDERADAAAVAGRPERSATSRDTSSAALISDRTYRATGRRVRTEIQGISDDRPGGGRGVSRSVAAGGIARSPPSGSRMSNRAFSPLEASRTTGNVCPKKGCCGSVTVIEEVNRSRYGASRRAWRSVDCRRAAGPHRPHRA